MGKTLESVVQDIGKRLTLSSPTYERAKALYDWMAQNVRYDYDRWNAIQSGSDERHILPPHEVLEHGKGVCGDLACLYVTLGRRLGIPVHYAAVQHNNQPHACAIVDLPERKLQVDPAFKMFDANHPHYRIEHPDVIEETRSFGPFIPFELPRTVKGVAAVLALCAGLATMFSPLAGCMKSSDLKYFKNEQSAHFSTKHGHVTFTIDAEKTWQEAVFFMEAANRDLDEAGLLKAYVQADKDANNTISNHEAQEARSTARAAYQH